MSGLWKEYVYEPCLHLVGPDYVEIALFVGATQCLHMLTFWSHSFFYLMIDKYPTIFSSVRKWKSQADVFITDEQIKKAVNVALFNQMFVNMPFALVSYYLFKQRGLQLDAASFPTATTVLRDFLVFMVFEEIGFYYGHRAAHLPALYARIHKKHHEFTAPIGCAAIYAHPLEHFFVNLTPLTIGPLIMNSHLFTYWLWLTIAVFSTITAHSGYHLPFLPSNEFHDYHHLKFNTNYGTFKVLDWWHGTDKMYEDTPQKKRDYIFKHMDDVRFMDGRTRKHE